MDEGSVLKRIDGMGALFHRVAGRPATGRVERGSLVLLPFFLSLVLLGFLPIGFGRFCTAAAILLLPVLLIFLLILLVRFVRFRLLWTVRNRLIVTYLLMGLAPLVLFVLLAGISAYIFSGQFATNLAGAALMEEQLLLKDRSGALTAIVGHFVENDPRASTVNLQQVPKGSLADARDAAWHDGKPVRLLENGEHGPARELTLPDWAQPGWNGLVAEDGRLFLRSVGGYVHDGHSVMVVVSVPLSRDRLDRIVQGLGKVNILPGVGLERKGQPTHDPAAPHFTPDIAPIRGGVLPPPAFFFDTPVSFLAPLHCIAWRTGMEVPVAVQVESRPALLYGRLFRDSVRIGAAVRVALLAVMALFALIEIFAFYMAVRMSRTVTQSVADLYAATRAIDGGNLDHRITVRRRDQLAALATSFNTMAGSLAAFLARQREQERVENELLIAQEVQNNLFPHSPVRLPGFELYGVCKPARAVSGDYYDFILDREGELAFALGDISGKGISAALLMASLHAAVRAYRATGDALEGCLSPAPDGEFASPGKLLALLNTHLYTTTQPEKYATLFFACYNSAARTLTYSNGGQLPPFLMGQDGSVRRLSCGGSVVGLLPGLSYREATVQLSTGDLLIAYSDGVTEPENEFGEFGESRLLDIVRAHQHESLAIIAQQALGALRGWIGEIEQPDDITLVLARQG